MIITVTRGVREGETGTRPGNGTDGGHTMFQEVVVLDVLDPVCVCTFISVGIKTNTETVSLRMLENV